MMRSVLALVALLIASSATPPLAAVAQPAVSPTAEQAPYRLQGRIATGAVFPRGTMEEQYYIGPNAILSLGYARPTGGLGVRIDASASYHQGRLAPGQGGRRFTPFAAYGLVWNAVYTVRGEGAQPYFLVGTGAFRQYHSSEWYGRQYNTAWYGLDGWDWAVQAGAGMRWQAGGLRLSAEVLVQDVLFSPWVLGPQLPVVLGVGF